MNTNSQPETFKTNISLIAHVQAEKFCRHQVQGIKAKQVYLNTLAVYVTNSYLNLIGWSTSLSQSDSWNPISQTLMNIADLKIPGYGSLECRPVFAGEKAVIIPPEVWSARIGYIVIRLEQDLKQAEILGFVPKVKRRELPIKQLEPMSKFPTYLSQQKRVESPSTTELSSWMQGGIGYGWQKFGEILPPAVVMNFRSKPELAQLPTTPASESRLKLVKLGTDLEHTIVLMLDIQPLSDREFNVSLAVRNHQSGQYLPEGLELIIVDQQQHPVMIAQANQTETIEFRFSGELQERFAVEIELQEQQIIENFVI